MDHANIKQPFLVAIRGKLNTIGHFVGIVQNMIGDAILMDGVMSKCENLDELLGETVTKLLWHAYDNIKPYLSI